MEKIGNNLAVPTAASGAGIKVSGSEMFSGALERSNTDIADEMINQIKNERFIEANTKIVKTEDENLGTLIDMKS
ncbi:TPA: flagellar basal body rod protein FlgG, partial [bacterium]|nr:flagellar basal body rod protein FlgG [bacterium]